MLQVSAGDGLVGKGRVTACSLVNGEAVSRYGMALIFEPADWVYTHKTFAQFHRGKRLYAQSWSEGRSCERAVVTYRFNIFSFGRLPS